MSSDSKRALNLALVHACAIGIVPQVNRLIERGAFVNAFDHSFDSSDLADSQVTALHAACCRNKLACVKFLIRNGANVNCKDQFNATALHIAADRGYLDILRVLLRNGADFDAEVQLDPEKSHPILSSEHGVTALHYAAANGNIACMRKLIRRGADVNIVDYKGRSSLYFAVISNNCNCVQIILKQRLNKGLISYPCNETLDTPLHEAVRCSMVGAVSGLLTCGANPNLKNVDGMTPLHCALSAVGGWCEARETIVQFFMLKSNKLDINAKDSRGFTPLHYVTFCFCEKFLRRPTTACALLLCGADPDIRSNTGTHLIVHELNYPGEDESILQFCTSASVNLPSAKTVSKNLSFSNPYTRVKLDSYGKMLNDNSTLMHLCRVKVRNMLGAHGLRFTENLPVPMSLKSYILLE